jgi:uncharacterized protein (TIGR00266 family)
MKKKVVKKNKGGFFNFLNDKNDTVQQEPQQPQQPQQPHQLAYKEDIQKLEDSNKNDNNLESKFTKSSKLFKTTKKGIPGSTFLKICLKMDQSVLTSPGSLIYLKGDVEKGEIKFDGIGKALWRGFGGEDMFITKYTGKKKSGEIAVGCDMPGDLVEIDIEPNTEWCISRGSFLCSTENLKISSQVVARGLFGIGTSEGFMMPLIQSDDKSGKFWLACYGTFEKIELKKNEDIIIDNGCFLAANKNMNYTIESLGKNLLGTLFGGEVFGMKFVGPGTIYIQSKNLNNFVADINSRKK